MLCRHQLGWQPFIMMLWRPSTGILTSQGQFAYLYESELCSTRSPAMHSAPLIWSRWLTAAKLTNGAEGGRENKCTHFKVGGKGRRWMVSDDDVVRDKGLCAPSFLRPRRLHSRTHWRRTRSVICNYTSFDWREGLGQEFLVDAAQVWHVPLAFLVAVDIADWLLANTETATAA